MTIYQYLKYNTLKMKNKWLSYTWIIIIIINFIIIMIREVQNKCSEHTRNIQIHELFMSNRHIDTNMLSMQINS